MIFKLREKHLTVWIHESNYYNSPNVVILYLYGKNKLLTVQKLYGRKTQFTTINFTVCQPFILYIENKRLLIWLEKLILTNN